MVRHRNVRPLNPADRKLRDEKIVRAAINDGLSTRNLAERFSCSTSVVQDVLRAAGIRQGRELPGSKPDVRARDRRRA